MTAGEYVHNLVETAKEAAKREHDARHRRAVGALVARGHTEAEAEEIIAEFERKLGPSR